MDNNYENLTADTMETAEDFLVSQDAGNAEEAVALAEEYNVSADVAENLPELQTEKKGKKAKASKPKKEKVPKEKKEKAPKPKKEKAPKVTLTEEEKAKKALGKRKKFHFMNFKTIGRYVHHSSHCFGNCYFFRKF